MDGGGLDIDADDAGQGKLGFEFFHVQFDGDFVFGFERVRCDGEVARVEAILVLHLDLAVDVGTSRFSLRVYASPLACFISGLNCSPGHSKRQNQGVIMICSHFQTIVEVAIRQ